MKRALPTLLALLLSACSGDDLLGPSDLAGGTWRLVEMQAAGEPTFVPEDPSRYTVQFEDDDRIGLRADCNVCGGAYDLDDDLLLVEPLACTLALCAPSGGEAFAGLVMGRSVLDLDGEELEMSSARGRLRLRR
jgi:heat shock protein HslJ